MKINERCGCGAEFTYDDGMEGNYIVVEIKDLITEFWNAHGCTVRSSSTRAKAVPF